MIDLAQTPQSNNGITHTQRLTMAEREANAAQHLGVWINRQVQNEMTARLAKQNRDGSWFTPQLIDSLTVKSSNPQGAYYHYIVVDPGSLWHFAVSSDALLSPWLLGHLSNAVRYPVTAFVHRPDAPRPVPLLPAHNIAKQVQLKYGIVYTVALREAVIASPLVEAERLPKSIRLDLGTMTIAKLNVPIGMSAKGVVQMPLAKLGHTLITGATGAGKSSWIHAALAALLTQNTAAEVRVALIDPKRSELIPWAQVPHLFGERIAHSSGDAEALLHSTVEEMNRRGELLGRAFCRDLAGYNARVESKDRLPYLLVVVDECLDLVMSSSRRVSDLLKSLAVRGRSAGIILWAATQHASAVEGLPRVVTLNLGSRLVFRVADANAARMAGCPGAQAIPRTLPGRFLAKLDGVPVLLQSFYLGDEDLRKISGQGTEVRGQELPERYRQLLTWAVEQGGGYLTLGNIMQVLGIGQREARRIAEDLMARGFTAKDPNNRNKPKLVRLPDT